METHIRLLVVNIFSDSMPGKRDNATLRLMITATILLAFFVIFIFLSSNNVSAQAFPALPH